MFRCFCSYGEGIKDGSGTAQGGRGRLRLKGIVSFRVVSECEHAWFVPAHSGLRTRRYRWTVIKKGRLGLTVVISMSSARSTSGRGLATVRPARRCTDGLREQSVGLALSGAARCCVQPTRYPYAMDGIRVDPSERSDFHGENLGRPLRVSVQRDLDSERGMTVTARTDGIPGRRLGLWQPPFVCRDRHRIRCNQPLPVTSRSNGTHSLPAGRHIGILAATSHWASLGHTRTKRGSPIRFETSPRA